MTVCTGYLVYAAQKKRLYIYICMYVYIYIPNPRDASGRYVMGNARDDIGAIEGPASGRRSVFPVFPSFRGRDGAYVRLATFPGSYVT